MAVFRTVQRFGAEAAHDRAPPGHEVDHLTLDSNVVDDAGAHGNRDEKDEWPESRCHVRDVRIGVRARSRDRPPPQPHESGGNQHSADAYTAQLHEVHIKRPPKKIQNRETREEDARRGHGAPGRRKVDPIIDETYVCRQPDRRST